jgi:hypothetical protein
MIDKKKIEELIKYFPKEDKVLAQKLFREENWEELFELTKNTTDGDFFELSDNIPESSIKLNELFIELLDSIEDTKEDEDTL